jgi:hypothetical protein
MRTRFNKFENQVYREREREGEGERERGRREGGR